MLGKTGGSAKARKPGKPRSWWCHSCRGG